MAVDENLLAEARQWVEDSWERIVSDIGSLVEIESPEDLSAAEPGAPFGPGPRAALSRALEMAGEMGLSTCDVDGYVGFADLPGAGAAQVGIIGHTDVVPAGPGWNFPPFSVTRKDGYLVGRGVIDDKGPLVCALHAVRFWKERGTALPATVRVIFGADEECGMKDVPYYRERYADPDFLFTPDAEFPVCYGEKGAWGGKVRSAVVEGGSIVALEGGTVANAVPGTASAVVRLPEGRSAGSLPAARGIAVEELGAAEAASLGGGAHLARVSATGKSAHASTPDLGVNAVGILFRYLVEQSLVGGAERAFLEFALRLVEDWRGAGWGLACEDADFGPLTAVGSVVALEGGRLTMLVDVRYPTATDAGAIEEAVWEAARGCGAELEVIVATVPFLAGRDAPEVQALIDVYNGVTGEHAEPFTMGGGTYARKFSRGVSFGVEKPWVEVPAWAGGMHGPDEAVSEGLLKEATAIYILAIEKLCEVVAAG